MPFNAQIRYETCTIEEFAASYKWDLIVGNILSMVELQACTEWVHRAMDLYLE